MSIFLLLCVISAVTTLNIGTTESKCVDVTTPRGTITNSFSVWSGVVFYKCWRISNPMKHPLTLHILSFGNYAQPCYKSNLTITLVGENRNLTFCNDVFTRDNITTHSDVEIGHSVLSAHYANNLTLNFTLTYDMYHLENITGLEEARSRAISWLYSHRSPLWDWRENTLKAVTVLFLAGNINSSATDLAKELMVKQAEFRVALSLQRNRVSESDLSTYIHFLLATCNRPRQFAGYDLIEHLKHKIESSNNLTHPIAYLALCNANESWPFKATADLSSILSRKSDYPLVRDIQAYAAMAVSCKINQTLNTEGLVNENLTTLYKKTINDFKQELSKGHAGNVYDTALLAQALLSSGEEFSNTWNSTGVMQFLIKELNSSLVDFQAVYFTLPLLRGKSFTDVATINCSENRRGNISDINDASRSRIQVPTGFVRFSLFIGDEKKTIHTQSIKTPHAFTAHQVMQMAETINPKYKFRWQKESGKMYVYNIAQTPNDPEAGKFWQLYLGSNNRVPKHTTKDPDELVLQDGDHLIYWYKTVKI